MDERARRIGLIIHGFSILGYLYTLAAVAAYTFFLPDRALTIVHAAAFLLVLGNQVAFLRHKNVVIAQNVFAGTGVLTIIPVFITGGVGGAGVVWYFAYLIFAFTLTGATMGLVWGGALILGTGLVLLWIRSSGSPLPYTFAFLLDAAWAFALSVGLLYIFNRAYEESQRRVEEKAAQDREIEALRRTDAIRNAMLSTVSHELKTPLTPLRLQTQILANPHAGPLTERQRKAVQILHRNIERLNSLVEQTLDVSRIQAGRINLDLREVDIEALARDAIQTFEESARTKGVHLALEGADAAKIQADETRLTQVLHNLISNALKFTPTEGRIAVRILDQRDGVRVEVRDTGSGFPSEDLGRLFQPFGRLEHVDSAKTDGTGLGLFISKGIVEAHGGTIEASSEGIGKGATFAFTLPRIPTRDARSSPPAP